MSELWSTLFDEEMQEDSWTSSDTRLSNSQELSWSELKSAEWDQRVALRSDYSRRQALLEVDVLTAMALGLSLDQLTLMYRVQFAVMQSYEQVDEYDARGRRLPNTKRQSAGGKEVREARKEHDGVSPLTVTWQTDSGSVTRTFYPPFRGVDREADYRQAWAEFERRYGPAPAAPSEISP